MQPNRTADADSQRLTAEFDEKLKQFDRATLEVMLRAVSARLGTPDEAPGDLELTRAMAHRINNLSVIDTFKDASLDDIPPRRREGA